MRNAGIFLLQGRVLAGVGRLLRIYDLGKKKLLRKCENKVRISSISSLYPPFETCSWQGIFTLKAAECS